MNLPGPFLRTIEQVFGQRGRDFLQALPDLVDEAARRWQLADVQPVSNLSYNYIAFADRLGESVVLKIGVPDRELLSEMTALCLFDGRAAVRLLDSDEEHSMFLLERLRPGDMLTTVEDDRQATEIAADLMRLLWRTQISGSRLIQLSDWFKGLEKLRRRFDGGTGPLAAHLVGRAESVARDFCTEDHSPTLLHGDLHHFNILSSKRGWLAIDPKGVVGPAAYEVGPFLINPWMVSGLQLDTPRLIRDRIAIFSERLGFEGSRLRDWGLSHAVLSAWWSLDGDEDWRPAMQCAEILAGMQT
jgi:streptomycin 6-kinase